MLRTPLRSTALLVACAFLAGCWLPGAARRSERILRDGWDLERRGGWVALTGPGATLLGTLDFLVNALVPVRYLGGPGREPETPWFRAYTGRMLPLEEVAILCKRERALDVISIRRAGDAAATRARHEEWQFPRCIEALPGRYHLEVGYFLRETYEGPTASTTETVESTQPVEARWDAEAGTLYLLRADLGRMEPAPEIPARRPRTLETMKGSWYVSTWTASVEPLPDDGDLARVIREQREAWLRYERER